MNYLGSWNAICALKLQKRKKIENQTPVAELHLELQMASKNLVKIQWELNKFYIFKRLKKIASKGKQPYITVFLE